MKRLVFLALSGLLVCFMLTGCSKSSKSQGTSTASSSKMTVVNVGLPVDIPSLSPFYGASLGGYYTLPSILQVLFFREHFGENATSVIGKSYILSDDEKTATVTLYDYVYDSAGNKITAQDVVFCYELAKQSGVYTNLNYMDSVTALDEYTVKFVLNEAAFKRFDEIWCQIHIVSKAAYDENVFATKPIGTGPYVVDTYIPGSTLKLVKNQNYWQKPELNHGTYAQNVDVIVFKVILESAQMVVALETGDIDLSPTVSFNDLTYFADKDTNPKKGYYVNKVNTNLFNTMALNVSGESRLSNNLSLRQAILYAIDNKSLVDGVLFGAGSVVSTWGSPVFGDYNPKWDTDGYYNYNPEKARQLLAEAGYKSGELTLRIMLENVETRKRAAEMIQAYLRAIGINSEILTYDASLFGTYKTDFSQWDLLLDNQGSSFAMRTPMSRFFVSGYTRWKDKPVNYCGNSDPKLDELCRASIAVGEKAGTQADVDALHQYIKDNAYGYGLWAAYVYQVSQDGINYISLDGRMYLTPGACSYLPSYVSKKGI